MSAAQRLYNIETAVALVGLACVAVYLLLKLEQWITSHRKHGRDCLCEMHVHERAMEALGDITRDNERTAL